MSSAEKILEKMRNNPQNWRIEHMETVARKFNINVRKAKGSHVVFEHDDWLELLSVPAHRPIKPIYVKKFVDLIDIFWN